MEDETIIGLYNDRDESAITETDKKYGGYCRTVSYNILQNRPDTEECVNDAYHHTWNAIPPERPRSLKAFVGRITRNLSLNRLAEKKAAKRGGGRYEAVYDELDASLSHAAAPDTLGDLELRDLLNRFLADLPEDRRNLFIGIDLADGDAQTGALGELARQYPGLRIAIGHFGMVTRPGWEEQIRLACLLNVYVESGGITWLFNAEYYPYPSAIRAILTARDLCGMDKLMWGSDYPRTMTAITYRMSWDFIEKSPLLTIGEKQQFFHENSHGFYRFGPLPELPEIHHMAE